MFMCVYALQDEEEKKKQLYWGERTKNINYF